MRLGLTIILACEAVGLGDQEEANGQIEERFRPAQGDAFTGNEREEKASACFGRNDMLDELRFLVAMGGVDSAVKATRGRRTPYRPWFRRDLGGSGDFAKRTL
jgi:hypothetical protein